MEKLIPRKLRKSRKEHYVSYMMILFPVMNVFWKNHVCQHLKIRMLRTMAIEVYKIINKQCPLYLQDLISIRKSKYSLRGENQANIPHVRTTGAGLHSLRYAGARLWNELPNDMRQEMSLNDFKNMIGTWSGSSCRCSACASQ